MDITEGEVYNNTIQINVSYSNLLTLRNLFNKTLEATTGDKPLGFEVSMKEFIRRMIRHDWSKFRQADRSGWYTLIDFVVDHCDSHEVIIFVHDKE